MNACTLNWQICLLFTDDFGAIYNATSSDRFAANMFADTDDVDGDGNKSEKFASIGSAQTLQIN